MAVASRGLRSRQTPSMLKRNSSNGKINFTSSFSGSPSPRKNTRGFHRANRDVYVSQTYPHLIISGLSPAQFTRYAPESDGSTNEDEIFPEGPDFMYDEEEAPASDDATTEPLRKRRKVEHTPASTASQSPVKRSVRSSRHSLMNNEVEVVDAALSRARSMAEDEEVDNEDGEGEGEEEDEDEDMEDEDAEPMTDITESKEMPQSPPKLLSHIVSLKRTHSSRLLSELNSRQSSRAGASPSPPATQATSPVPSLPDSQADAARGASASPRPHKDPNELLESDLPPPFLPELSPPSPSTFQDKAAHILATKFAPIPVPRNFVRALTSHDVSERSTETLFRLAENTQRALVAWQNQYLELDAKTAPIQNPPKKVATGGRVPLEKAVYERTKEIELWGHVLGVEGTMAAVDGTGRRAVAPPPAGEEIAAGGRSLRRRHADASLADSLGAASDDEAGVGKRTRKPVRRFDVGSNQGGRRKRRGGADASLLQSGPRKRGRLNELAGDDRSRTLSPTPESVLDRLSDAGPESETEWPAQRNASARGRGGRGRGRGGRGRGRRGAAASQTGRASEQRNPSQEETSIAQPLPADTTTKLPIPKAASAAGAGSLAPKIATGAEPGATDTTLGGAAPQRRPRVKSEKRSESMTAWWAQRKKKAAEEKIRELREKGLLDRNGAPVPGAGAHAAGYMMGGTPMMQFAPQPPQQVWSLPPAPPPPPPPPAQPSQPSQPAQPAQSAQQMAPPLSALPPHQQGSQAPPQQQHYQQQGYPPHPHPAPSQQQQQQQQQQRQAQQQQQQQHPHQQQPQHHYPHQLQHQHQHQHQHQQHPQHVMHYGGPPHPHPSQAHGYPPSQGHASQAHAPPPPPPPQYAQQPLHGQGRAGYMFGH